jgi:hypothetical protein
LDKQIKNKGSYPDAVWQAVPTLIGDVGGQDLYLLGVEYGTLVDNPKDYPLVAIDRGDDTLFADTLGEMMTFIREPINITGSLS